jgi:hypothetical protein
MDCRMVRDRILREEQEAVVSGHLAACPDCSLFAQRLATARRLLRAPKVPVEPDPSFALRVVARLPRPAELMGWAALRALPAALLLALALAWVGLSEPPSPSNLLSAEPSSDLLLTYGMLAAERER